MNRRHLPRGRAAVASYLLPQPLDPQASPPRCTLSIPPHPKHPVDPPLHDAQRSVRQRHRVGGRVLCAPRGRRLPASAPAAPAGGRQGPDPGAKPPVAMGVAAEGATLSGWRLSLQGRASDACLAPLAGLLGARAFRPPQHGRGRGAPHDHPGHPGAQHPAPPHGRQSAGRRVLRDQLIRGRPCRLHRLAGRGAQQPLYLRPPRAAGRRLRIPHQVPQAHERLLRRRGASKSCSLLPHNGAPPTLPAPLAPL